MASSQSGGGATAPCVSMEAKSGYPQGTQGTQEREPDKLTPKCIQVCFRMKRECLDRGCRERTRTKHTADGALHSALAAGVRDEGAGGMWEGEASDQLSV